MPTQAAASSTWCSSRSRPQHVGSPAGAALEAKEFYAKKGATEAHDRNDRIIYDKSSGKIYYDEDGNKAGGLAPCTSRHSKSILASTRATS